MCQNNITIEFGDSKVTWKPETNKEIKSKVLNGHVKIVLQHTEQEENIESSEGRCDPQTILFIQSKQSKNLMQQAKTLHNRFSHASAERIIRTLKTGEL